MLAGWLLPVRVEVGLGQQVGQLPPGPALQGRHRPGLRVLETAGSPAEVHRPARLHQRHRLPLLLGPAWHPQSRQQPSPAHTVLCSGSERRGAVGTKHRSLPATGAQSAPQHFTPHNYWHCAVLTGPTNLDIVSKFIFTFWVF